MSLKFDQIKNDKVILRCDFNESIEGGLLKSTKRIDANLQTLNVLLAQNNSVVLISHHSDKGQSLRPVYNYIKSIYTECEFLGTEDYESLKEYINLNKNNLPRILLLENVRLFCPSLGEGGEAGRGKSLDEANDPDFAKTLSLFGNSYVYDAFSAAHRDHASTIGITNFLNGCLGPVANLEYNNLAKLLNEIHESIFIMGGAKISTKLAVISNLLQKGARIFLGGAMVHNILKLKGLDIKNSYFENTEIDLSSIINNESVVLPEELVWSGDRIVDDILDFEKMNKIIKEDGIKNIFWNGPVGIFEEGHTLGTDKVFNFLNRSKLNTIVGGGDTLTYLEGKKDYKFTYLSLSGGAMLEFLSGKKLSVIEKLR